MEHINDSGVTSFVAGDEVIQLRFGLPANRMLITRWSQIPDFQDNLNEAEIAWLLFAGYTNACMAKGMDALKTYEFFYEVVEGNSLTPEGIKAISNIAECYARSKYTKKFLEDVNAATEEIKKKTQSIGMPSNLSATENLDSSHPNITG